MCRHTPVFIVRFARIKMVVQEVGDPYVEYDTYGNAYDISKSDITGNEL